MVTNSDIAFWVVEIAGLCFITILSWPRKAPRLPIKRVQGRRQQLMKELLAHKYLDHYELARRTEIPFDHVSKLLAAAFAAGEPLERIKRQVEVPESCRREKKIKTVWCYRIKAPYTQPAGELPLETGGVVSENTAEDFKAICGPALPN